MTCTTLCFSYMWQNFKIALPHSKTLPDLKKVIVLLTVSLYLLSSFLVLLLL